MRRLGSVAAALLFVACQGARAPEPEALLLRGFRLVDVEARQVRDADVVIENGVVVAQPRLAKRRVIEGHGAFLMPALWDMKASLWGNDSALDWDVLTQDVGFTQCLGLHLYYGVAHVGVFGMQRDWVERELKRADALGLAAAEPLYPDTVICGGASFACEAVKDAAAARHAVAERQHHAVPLIYVSVTHQKKDPTPGVSDEVLGEVVKAAANVPTIVLVDDWAQAEKAVQLGVKIIYGLPAGPIPDSLLELMRSRGAALAPALTRYLELDSLLGNESKLVDPFLRVAVRPDVLDSFRSEKQLWSEFLPELRRGRERRAASLETVARAVQAGVPVLAASDAGWTAGTFQGYSSHGVQAWLARAGLDAWTRLSAATVWPAAALGRHVGFAPGDPADFIMLEESPLEDVENLRKIEQVMRRGKLVDRAKLLPDLTRAKYAP